MSDTVKVVAGLVVFLFIMGLVGYIETMGG